MPALPQAASRRRSIPTRRRRARRLLAACRFILALVAFPQVGAGQLDELADAARAAGIDPQIAREILLDEARNVVRQMDGAESADALSEDEVLERALAIRRRVPRRDLLSLETRAEALHNIIARESAKRPPDVAFLADLKRAEADALRELAAAGSNPLLSDASLKSEARWRADAQALEALRGRWTETLRRALAGSDRIRFVAAGFSYPSEAGRELLEIEGAERAEEFLQRVQIDEQEGISRCMCDGDFKMEFYAGQELRGILGFHHGRTLRWIDGEWMGDGELTAPSSAAVRDWITSVGYTGRRDWDE